MASIPLTFIPPTEPDITTLHIWESDAPDGDFYEIDSTPVGTYPDYIDRYVTTRANSVLDWFAIQWEDSEGALSALSAPIKGGTTTLIGEIIERVKLRAPNLNETIIVQEAEATVSYVFRVDDPYTVDLIDVN